jgi:hypothetical protein
MRVRQNLFTLFGNLRAGSYNTSARRTLQQLAPEGVAVALYEGLGDVPHCISGQMTLLVMPALVAGIHALEPLRPTDVDGRIKPGQDGRVDSTSDVDARREARHDGWGVASVRAPTGSASR